jgi:lipooligosaccharide transport system permease protein
MPKATSRVIRLDRTALLAVIVREMITFRPFWRATTFECTLEPTIYLLAFGFGFGSILSQVEGHTYIDYVGTGVVASAVLSGSMFSAAYWTFIKCLEHTYESMLSAPVDADDVVTGEVLWSTARTAVYACAPVVVAVAFGLRPSPGVLLVPLISAVAAFGWASFGIFIGVKSKRVESFAYVQTGLVMPVTLLGGIFFPLSGFPVVIQALAFANPVFHCVELVRHATFGALRSIDLGHLAFLLAFALVAWRLAIHSLAHKLVI